MANKYEPLAVANYFIERGKESRRPLTQMQLHKLLYFAHGWSYGIHGDGLISGDVEAWKYGPVFRSLYHNLKNYGSDAIPAPLEEFDGFGKWTIPSIPIDDTRTRGLLDRVWEVYGSQTAAQLSRISHEQDGPWDKTVKQAKGEKYAVIPAEEIRSYFLGKATSNAAKRAPKAPE